MPPPVLPLSTGIKNLTEKTRLDPRQVCKVKVQYQTRLKFGFFEAELGIRWEKLYALNARSRY